jgi:hypothetical protein
MSLRILPNSPPLFSKSEAQRELIDVARVDENTLRKDISAYQTLNLLALKRRFYRDCLDRDIIRKDQTYTILIAGNILRTWCTDMNKTNGLKTQLLYHTGLNHTSTGARINHTLDRYWIRNFSSGFLDRFFNWTPDPHAHIDQWPEGL